VRLVNTLFIVNCKIPYNSPGQIWREGEIHPHLSSFASLRTSLTSHQGSKLFNFDFAFVFRHIRDVSPPNFCSCLIHQAHLPNKLGNYILNFALSFCFLIFELCFPGMSNPPYGGVEPPFLKGDLEGFLYEVMRLTIIRQLAGLPPAIIISLLSL